MFPDDLYDLNCLADQGYVDVNRGLRFAVAGSHSRELTPLLARGL